jgi:hypothetical protein
MTELASGVVAALEGGGLQDQLIQLQDRVLSRGADAIFEREPGEREWNFKPMVELLLLELGHVAALTAIPAEARRRQITWTLDMAGF